MNSKNLNNDKLKNRGYLHLSDQVNLLKDRKKIIALLNNESYVSRHAFFPLIHSVINERRYKKISASGQTRAHSYYKDNEKVKNLKSRPLHYASHLDAVIFSYYAEKILKEYESYLFTQPTLSECIIAYRRIPINGEIKNKSTIHFAHETFNAIKFRANEECEVLKFDIKNFFSSIDHEILKKSWANLLHKEELPNDHYNVFKASTRFSYVLKDDFRVRGNNSGRRTGFDEKRLSNIRKKGIYSFFESAKDFRSAVANGEVRIHKYPFRNDAGIPIGIPQGLPISAVLANLYLLEFDKKIVQNLVQEQGVFYRRYSDDIVLICTTNQANEIEKYIIEAIKESKVDISKDKTERFLFKKDQKGILRTHKIENGKLRKGVPFTYLGFEYYGDKTLVKSANLAKFYRRMIRAVKSKAKRAFETSVNQPGKPIIIFKRQLIKLYTKYPLTNNRISKNFKKLVKNQLGEYQYNVRKKKKTNNSNYLSYIYRASEIMEEDAIKNQIQNHKNIFNQAMKKYLSRVKDKI